MSREYVKTLTYLAIHLTIGFTVVYLLTGSWELAGGVAIIEPCCNAIAFFFHERAWQKWGGTGGSEPVGALTGVAEQA